MCLWRLCVAIKKKWIGRPRGQLIVTATPFCYWHEFRPVTWPDAVKKRKLRHVKATTIDLRPTHLSTRTDHPHNQRQRRCTSPGGASVAGPSYRHPACNFEVEGSSSDSAHLTLISMQIWWNLMKSLILYRIKLTFPRLRPGVTDKSVHF